jgi:hypothetical protein
MPVDSWRSALTWGVSRIGERDKAAFDQHVEPIPPLEVKLGWQCRIRCRCHPDRSRHTHGSGLRPDRPRSADRDADRRNHLHHPRTHYHLPRHRPGRLDRRDGHGRVPLDYTKMLRLLTSTHMPRFVARVPSHVSGRVPLACIAAVSLTVTRRGQVTAFVHRL